MNDDQITALAREFSKEHDDSTIAYHAAKDVLVFISTRFCLAGKEAAKEQYAKWMQQFCGTRDIAAKEYAAGWISALESLFPEIGKEVEDA